MGDLARFLILLGGAILLLGVVLLLAGRIPWLGHLPGDIQFSRGNVSCTFPLATSLLLSLLLTILLNVVLRLWRR